MKTFSKWTIEEIEDTFAVVLHKKAPFLMDWLIIKAEPSAEEQQALKAFSELIQDHVWDWNEEELKIKFIAPLLKLVNFDTDKYQSFFERELLATIGEEQLSGIVDFLVATGRRSPKKPLFFIHEYKKEKDSSNDPLGQLMAALIAAQIVNNDKNRVYGVYVIGRLWFFVVLNGKEYSVSEAYNAEKDEINKIFCILKNTKKIIDDLICMI